MDPALQELLLAELDPDEIVEALVRLTDENVIPDKLTPISQFGDIISCRIRRSDILDIYNSEFTKSMKAARFVAYNRNFESNNSSAIFPHEQSNSSVSRGNNTIVAVLDWGIDFAHPNFRNSDGSTRFIAIWDQSFRDETGLAPYGYGRLFKREQINQALQSKTPYKCLNYHPGKSDSLGIGTHGTHVMDIAAGNGKIGNKGVASEADLIFVHLASRGTSGTGNLGDSVRILEGIDAVKTIAGNQSLVINMSIGRHGGPHDGKTLVEQGIDNFLESRNNTMICQSTGNYYKENAHHSGIVRPGKIKTFSFLIQRADRTLNEMEIWYHGNDQFRIELINNKSGQSFKCPINSRQNIILNGKKIGRIYHRDSEPNNGKNHINLFLYKNAPSGRWTVKLKGEKVSDGRYHAWIERDGSCKNCQSRFDPSFADASSTTGTIANGFNSIVCGAFDATLRSFAMAPFSSKGPTLDGRSKPDIVASGRYISAARSTPASSEVPRPSTTRMSGTSMASPRVAGATALVLEQLPPNTPFWQIRNIIIGTANPVKTREPSRVGAGKLNIPAAVNTAKRLAERLKNRKGTLALNRTSNTFRLPPMSDASIIENYAPDINTDSDGENFLQMDTLENQTGTNSWFRDTMVSSENVNEHIKNIDMKDYITDSRPFIRIAHSDNFDLPQIETTDDYDAVYGDSDLEQNFTDMSENSARSDLNISSSKITEYDYILNNKYNSRKTFKARIKKYAKWIDLSPGLISINLISESNYLVYLRTDKVDSYIVGVDDYYIDRKDIKAMVGSKADEVKWDRLQTPSINPNELGRNVKTIDFDTGEEAMKASIVYLKYRQGKLQQYSKSFDSDFLTYSKEIQYCLLRLSFNAGLGRARTELEKYAKKSKSPLILTNTGGPQRRATIKAAQAIHMDATIFKTVSSSDNFVETNLAKDYCHSKNLMIRIAVEEEGDLWTRPNGTKFNEGDHEMFEELVRYWQAVPGVNKNRARAIARISASDHPRIAFWSAAFICSVMRGAGITINDGFVFSRRHVRYIVGALRNRENSDASKIFWLYDRLEMLNSAYPRPGDLICRNTTQNHSYASLRRRYANNNDIASGSSHTDIVVGSHMVNGNKIIETIGGNVRDSVSYRHIMIRNNRIYDVREDGTHPRVNHSIFGIIKFMAC